MYRTWLSWYLEMIDEDELYEAMVELTEIKNHLKHHFDLWGDNQPWHMFDDVEAELMVLVNKE